LGAGGSLHIKQTRSKTFWRHRPNNKKM
jgi:hypothetical protein